MASKLAIPTVDAHHHLWQYTTAEYGWINDSMQALRRDFLPDDLRAEMLQANVQASVAVQARQTLKETRWLLQLAQASELIRGVVGWAPLISPDIESILHALSGETKLKGLRHGIQDEPDDNFLLRKDFNRGIAAMTGTALVYDILIYAKHLPRATAFVDRHPTQPFVLDHIAKPPIALGDHGLEPWAKHIRELARRPNVSCKLSGMVTEADWHAWSLEILRPYLDVVVESFGPERLMAGSDWPVCLVATGYKQWFDTLREYFSSFSEEETTAIFGGNAVSVYRL